MAATVLGKRARALDASSPVSARKRITRGATASQQQQTAAVQIYEDARDEDLVTEEVLEDPFNDPETPSKNVISSPVTRGRPKTAFSPTKIERHFKSTKQAPNVLNASEDVENSIFAKYAAPPTREPVQLPTPKTPRHRDALSKKIPITPRHKHIVGARLFTPKTPRTPSTPSNAPSIYNSARQLFVKSTNPGRLIGRDEERAALNTFIQMAITSQSGRCLYVSGPPGTGKSALVGEVCGDVIDKNVRHANINCMSFKSSKDITSKLIQDLHDGDEMDLDEACGLTILKDMFIPKKRTSETTYLVTLDEIDHLLTLDLEILTTLFEWSLHRSSRLILIGIANALDLTDRFLPRLKARNLKPQLLPFLPYTVPQIASVITAKLNSLLPPDTEATTTKQQPPFIAPSAIQFCAKKVASQSGDLRKAFDIIRSTLSLIEEETKKAACPSTSSKVPLGENMNISSPTSSPSRQNKVSGQFPLDTSHFQSLTPLTAPRATISHVARVTSSALPSTNTPTRLSALNLQQKAALCALISLEKRLKNEQAEQQYCPPTPTKARLIATPTRRLFKSPVKSTSVKAPTAPTIRTVYTTYAELCTRDNTLLPLSATEFADVVNSLEALGLVGEEGKTATKGKNVFGGGSHGRGGELRRVGSLVGEKEVDDSLDSGAAAAILRGLMSGGN